MKLINKPIEMVCIFSKDGKVTPFKLRLQDEFGEEQVYMVKPITVDKNKILHNYHCTIEMDGVVKKCTIHYYISECKWVLYCIN